MKSSWLKDALSEIDASCDYVTITCNPPQKVTGTGKGRAGDVEAPIFRIEAKSMRGSVEVSNAIIDDQCSLKVSCRWIIQMTERS
jgi:Repair protein Rad1/Rec1/Rad17